MLLGGIESKLDELRQHSKGALFVVAGGAALPLLLGFCLGWVILPASDLKTAQALLIGATMSITSIPATIKVLTEFGLFHSRVGQMVVEAAIFDDVLGLFLLAILTALIQTGQPSDFMALVMLLDKVIVFLGITLNLGVHVYPRVSRGLKGLQSAALGMHWILGAFLAGLFFESSRVGFKAYQEIKLVVTAITRGFLGPLFFASIGLQVAFGAATHFPWLIGLLILVAFFRRRSIRTHRGVITGRTACERYRVLGLGGWQRRDEWRGGRYRHADLFWENRPPCSGNRSTNFEKVESGSLDPFTVDGFIPFDPAIKRTEATMVCGQARFKVAKGAPQVILNLSANHEQLEAQVNQQVEELAGRGYRTLTGRGQNE